MFEVVRVREKMLEIVLTGTGKREFFAVRENIFEVVPVREKMLEIVLTGTGKREFFPVRVRDFLQNSATLVVSN